MSRHDRNGRATAQTETDIVADHIESESNVEKINVGIQRIRNSEPDQP